MKNLYKLYYKDYFQGIDFSVLLENKEEAKKKNRQVIERVNREILDTPFVQPSERVRANWCPQLKVEYPGLVTGIGINHEANIEGEFKLGIHLDYLTGMPVIYGSSVKGMLRDVFSDVDYIKRMLGKILEKGVAESIDVNDLVKDIFDGKEVEIIDGLTGKEKKYRNKSIYKRDIFHDAVLISGDSQGKVLRSDYITPHFRDVLKDPIPIGFVKIAPGAVIEFRFRLVDSDYLSKEQKCSLFYCILQTFAVGAKTNVGYGNLTEREEPEK